jgi:GH15 family glucan-1,4-alpha-glucosidase
MPLAIEDYGLISDCYTGALVGKDGSIDWLCLPHYDSPSMFGALLGDENHGRWLLAPSADAAAASRHYDCDTFMLVTRWTTSDGEAEVLDLMPHGNARADVVRRVRGVRGTVRMRQDLRVRFAYADSIPWMRKEEAKKKAPRGLIAVAGSSSVVMRGPELQPAGHSHQGTFDIREGETVDLTLTWFPSHKQVPEPLDVDDAIVRTRQWWTDWADACSYDGPYRKQVMRSLLVLRALTHAETGGIVAAATTSLPESIGGSRNWDYRYVWLRDASMTISVLLRHGYYRAANHWREWLLRAIAGDPADVQIMYAINGDRYLAERELGTLPGYLGSAPVRVGNAAFTQFQADVIGEVMIALQEARQAGIKETEFSWSLQRALIGFLEKEGMRPDSGMWEIRGKPKYFTQSRAMVWAAYDSAVRAVRDFGMDGPVDQWEKLRDQTRREIETKGFDKKRGTYTQYFGSRGVDASLLLLPQVGYCAPDDRRMRGTVDAIERDLMKDGLPLRYKTDTGVDGLPGAENPFLACGFWLVEQYARSKRLDDAEKMMGELLSYGNELDLFSEEYDVENQRQAGNTPQALTHLALVRAAEAITRARSGNGLRSRTGDHSGG